MRFFDDGLVLYALNTVDPHTMEKSLKRGLPEHKKLFLGRFWISKRDVTVEVNTSSTCYGLISLRNNEALQPGWNALLYHVFQARAIGCIRCWWLVWKAQHIEATFAFLYSFAALKCDRQSSCHENTRTCRSSILAAMELVLDISYLNCKLLGLFSADLFQLKLSSFVRIARWLRKRGGKV